MAEVLGIVSSVITVIETAGKLGSSAIKLKQLWDEVQYVPESIKRQMQHLDMLTPVLEDMEYEFQQTRNMVRNDRTARRSLENCRKVVSDLEELVEDMQSQVTGAKKGRRTTAKFKVTLKKAVVQEYHERLGSALQLLAMSQQTYLFALTRAQPSMIVSEFQAIQAQSREANESRVQVVEDEADVEGAHRPVQEGESCARQQVRSRASQTRFPSRKTRRLPHQNPGFLPRLAYEVAEACDGDSGSVTSQVYQARLQLPWWLAQKAWDFQAYRSYDGWKIQLTPWCTRPFDSIVFDYAIVGDTDGLLAAIAKKEGSLYDRDPDGDTLLDYALFTPQIDLCMWLVHNGLKFEQRAENSIVFHQYIRGDVNISLTDVLDFNRFLAENGGFEDEIFSWEHIDPGLLLDILTSQDLVSPAQFRAQQPSVAMSCSFGYQYFSRAIHMTMAGAGPEWSDNMRALARWLLTGASGGETVQVMAGGMSSYILYLMEAGVDLEAYGELEDEFLAVGAMETDLEFPDGSLYPASMGPYIVWAEYGPRPEDWIFEYDPCVEEYAGEFWWVLANEERLMPGPMPGGWEDE
ncbi:hypothetical protein BGZ61DRAFT_520818 [Ilyonectria robusta]|uniref:uncharacterized protein n=1 Tax=Ilyonectria robusta TaxID=1079257 RepID=UPI001E8CD7C6|nr:uncharacterized protein BGZ61DRAFT_520818 [Ilyonectria robusta]KAH8674930.1 hypothetical protein BGZ61DRAFT_520818 [Ilyonectria robusta]